MKRIRPIVPLVLALALILAPFAWAAASGSAKTNPVDHSPGAQFSQTLSTITGVAISPLLGTSALGAFQWMAAKDETARARLPWYAQPKFWVPALLVVLVCAAKDGSGVVLPPMLKKPLDALEVVENKFSGLIAAGAVIPYATDALWKMLLQESGGGTVALAPGPLAMISPLAMSWAPVLNVLTVPLAIVIFAVVWMASHAINVLILLSPWGAIDAGLKAARTSLLGLLVLTTAINPWVGALLSVAIIVVAYFVAGWSFRLTVFGAVLCWDFFTGRRGRFVPAENGNALFSASAFGGVPVRTYGRLVRRADGGFEFAYRPWLVRPVRAVALAVPVNAIAVGRGLIFSNLATETGTLFLLPPRYRGHEDALVKIYGFGRGVRPAGLRKAWGSLREMVGGKSEPAVAA